MKKLVIYDGYEMYSNDEDEIIFELSDPDILVDVFSFYEKLDLLYMVGINQNGADVSLRIEDFDNDYIELIYEKGYIRIILKSPDNKTIYFDENVEIK